MILRPVEVTGAPKSRWISVNSSIVLVVHIHFKSRKKEMRLPGCTDSVMPNGKSKGNKINWKGPGRAPS